MKPLLLILTALACTFGASGQWIADPAVPADYTRLTKTYTTSGSGAMLTLTVDFPDGGAPYAGEVNEWLVRLANRAFMSGDSFGGAPYDRVALGQFVARKFFRFAEQEVRHDSVPPAPYDYSYSMLVNTAAPRFITYAVTSDLELGRRNTMTGRQLVTFLYNAGDATNDVLFSKNKFKAVKEALLKVAFTDAAFMQSSLVKGQGISKSNQLRPLFSAGGDDGWDGMILPPGALTPQGVTFSFAPAIIGPQGKVWYHFTVPYDMLRKCFTDAARQAINASYPSALAKN